MFPDVQVVKVCALIITCAINFQVSCQDTTFIKYDYPSNYVLNENSSNISFNGRISLFLSSISDSCKRLFIFDGKTFNKIGADFCFSESMYQLPINDTLAMLVDSTTCILINYNTGQLEKLHYKELIHRGYVYKTVSFLGRIWITGTRDQSVYLSSSYTSCDMLKQNIFLMTNERGTHFHCLSLDSCSINGGAFVYFSNYNGRIPSSIQQIVDTSVVIELDTIEPYINCRKLMPINGWNIYDRDFYSIPFKLGQATISKVFGDTLYILDPERHDIGLYPMSYSFNSQVYSQRIKKGIKSMHKFRMSTYFFYQNHMEISYGHF